jgi:hypothetical protein
VGLEDIVPGIENDKIPNPRTATKVLSIGLLPEANLYIHNIQMITTIDFESRFENFLRKMKQEKYKGIASIASNNHDNVLIDERRITVSVNNTWKNIVEDSYVSMSTPN